MTARPRHARVVAALLAVGLALPTLAAAPFGRYVLTEDTVTDVKTRLVWQRHVPVVTRKWMECLSYCEDLALAEATDWRLPNARELVTLFDHATDPVYDGTAFNGEPMGAGYYTSSVVLQANRSVSFDRLGQRSENNNTATLYCRCVRGPDPEPAPN